MRFSSVCGTICFNQSKGGVSIRNRYIPPEDLAKIRARLTGADALLTDVLLATGFRLDDVMHVRVHQLRGSFVTLCERKTGHMRTVAVDEETRSRVAAATYRRHPWAYAFPALRAGGRRKMHRTTYWRHFEAAVVACGFKGKGYTPHSLRKCYAVRRLCETGSLSAVQADLGHTKPEITAIYAFSDRWL